VPRPTGASPFVGRQDELGRLLRCLDEARSSRGQLALIAGEPGIGKTRLLTELAERAGAAGWVVLHGRGYDVEGLPPYLPFTEALRDYIRAAPLEDLRSQLDEAGPEVSLIAPDLRRRLPDLAIAPVASSAEQRYQLFESVCDFLLGIPGRQETRGLLCLLDDLHWADGPSLLLLNHLARRLSDAPLLVVGAYRTVDLNRVSPLTNLLGELRRENIGERVLVGPLSTPELSTLVEGLTGHRPASTFVDAIARQTDGNPFFIGEIVRHLIAEGRFLAEEEAASVSSVPEGVREVITRRLARLAPATHELLLTAAVLGEGFGFEQLRTAVGVEVPEWELLNALEEALDAGMLRESADGFQFGHALIRRTLYDGMSGPRRQRLHLRAAEAIERTERGNLGPRVAELSVHYRLAGPLANPATAIDYAVRAGEAAEAIFAFEEAVLHCTGSLPWNPWSVRAPRRNSEHVFSSGWLPRNSSER